MEWKKHGEVSIVGRKECDLYHTLHFLLGSGYTLVSRTIALGKYYDLFDAICL